MYKLQRKLKKNIQLSWRHGYGTNTSQIIDVTNYMMRDRISICDLLWLWDKEIAGFLGENENKTFYFAISL